MAKKVSKNYRKSPVKKKALTKKLALSNPFCTGGGGTDYENSVAAYYLVTLIGDKIVRGLGCNGSYQISLQRRYAGNLVDDIQVTCNNGGVEKNLYLQVKHNLAFSKNQNFKKVVQECWLDYSNKKFSKKNDRIGIVISQGSYIADISKNFPSIFEMAQTSSSAADFLNKIKTSKKKFSYYKLIKETIPSNKKTKLTGTQVFDFLKCLAIIPFEFEGSSARDAEAAWNHILELLTIRDEKNAQFLFNGLKGLISQYSKSGGTITIDTLRSKIPAKLIKHPSDLTKNLRVTSGAILERQSAKIQALKNSKKYIPEVFIEIDDVKEKTRFFTDPTLFWGKVIEDIQYTDFRVLNEYLKNFNIPPFRLNLPKKFVKPPSIEDMGTKGKELVEFLRQKLEELDGLTAKNLEKKKKIPPEKLKFFYETNYQFEEMWFWKRKIEGLIEYIELLNAKVLILLSNAGHGKTNFLCDFAENVLEKKKILYAFFGGSDFDFSLATTIQDQWVENLTYHRIFSDFNECVQKISEVCRKNKTPFIFIIDGLNENGNIAAFAKKLEKFIESLQQHDYIKVLITCRTEYFDQRFKALESSSFKDATRIVRIREGGMSDLKKERMFYGYFRFFKINFNQFSGDAYDKLARNPLLLRIFCETYGDHSATKPVNLGRVFDIYRESLFKAYLEKKIKEIEDKMLKANKNTLGTKGEVRIVLLEIIKHMINSEVFSNIPLSALMNQNNKETLSFIIEEEILLRKDLGIASALDAASEVISFTFDEFRDYLIAHYLIYEIYPKDVKVFSEIVSKLTDPQCPVAEGLSRYLFYITKTGNDSVLAGIIKSQSWYERIYWWCIFSTEDKFITKEDVKLIAEKFIKDPQHADKVIECLIFRYEHKSFPNLNSGLLIELAEQMNDSQYESSVNAHLSVNRWRSYDPRWNVEMIIINFDFHKILAEDAFKEDEEYHNLFMILIFLFGVVKDYSPWQQVEDLYKQYASKYPDRAILSLTSLARIKIKSVQKVIWKILKELARECPEKIPPHFSLSVLSEVMEDPRKPGSTLDARDVMGFIEEVEKVNPAIFDQAQKEHIHKYRQEVVNWYTKYVNQALK